MHILNIRKLKHKSNTFLSVFTATALWDMCVRTDEVTLTKAPLSFEQSQFGLEQLREILQSLFLLLVKKKKKIVQWLGLEPVYHLHMVLVLFKAVLWASLRFYSTSVKSSRGECLDDYFGVWLQPVVHPDLLLAYSCCSLILTSLSTICTTADLLLHPGVWNWESCTSSWWKLLLLLWEQYSSGQIWTWRNQWSMTRGPVWKTLCPLYSPRLLSCVSPWSRLSSPHRPGRASPSWPAPSTSRSLLMYWMNQPSRTQEVFLKLTLSGFSEASSNWSLVRLGHLKLVSSWHCFWNICQYQFNIQGPSDFTSPLRTDYCYFTSWKVSKRIKQICRTVMKLLDGNKFDLVYMAAVRNGTFGWNLNRMFPLL